MLAEKAYWLEGVCRLIARANCSGMGDGRTYDQVCAPSAANRISNEVPSIKRLVCDVTSKPPDRIEFQLSLSSGKLSRILPVQKLQFSAAWLLPLCSSH